MNNFDNFKQSFSLGNLPLIFLPSLIKLADIILTRINRNYEFGIEELRN